MTCQYATSDRVQAQEVVTSRMVSDIVDSLSQLCKLKMSPEFVSIFAQLPTLYYVTAALLFVSESYERGSLWASDVVLR